MSLDVSEPTVVVALVRKRVVLPTTFPGRGCKMHHTLSAGFIVSILMGLSALLIVLSSSRMQTSLPFTEQISMRSLKKDGEGGNLGAEMVRSSSLSEDVDDEEGRDPLDVDPKESSESDDGRRGVARTVREGEAMISVGGRICCILLGAISSSKSSSESQGC